jgi:hypothetical protein
MDTVLFTDHGILVFVITMSAIALMLSVLDLRQRIGRAPPSSTNGGEVAVFCFIQAGLSAGI